MKDLHRRRGKVTVSKELLFDSNLDSLKLFFGNFYPISGEWSNIHGFADEVVYYGFSEHFEVVEEGRMAPEYSAEISMKADKPATIKFFK